VIVTDNLADFPPAALPASIARQSLDGFLLDLLDLHPGQVVTAVRAIAELLRIMKLTEETGEVTQAVTGTLGQNPRKGVTHTWEDVQAELCDVIFTAMVALTTLTPDARETFDGHLARVAARSLGTPRAVAAS